MSPDELREEGWRRLIDVSLTTTAGSESQEVAEHAVGLSIKETPA